MFPYPPTPLTRDFIEWQERKINPPHERPLATPGPHLLPTRFYRPPTKLFLSSVPTYVRAATRQEIAALLPRVWPWPVEVRQHERSNLFLKMVVHGIPLPDRDPAFAVLVRRLARDWDGGPFELLECAALILADD